MSPEQALATGSTLLYRQGRLLDERRWQDWLALFTEDCQYWVPAWVSEQRQTEDPDREVSLIYYDLRSRLADRVWRVESGALVSHEHCVSNTAVRAARNRAAGGAGGRRYFARQSAGERRS
jgi:3-phenylpropionate/cinnamic acid dioxygenase small subunit